MSMPDLHWIKRRTTLEALLDGGVENGSDVASLRSPPPPPQPVDPALVARRAETLERARTELAARQERARRRAVSWFGAVLGALLAVGGAAMVASPTEMRVLHVRTSHLPTFWEHVTPARFRLYGAYGLAFGMCLLAYSLRRPPVDHR